MSKCINRAMELAVAVVISQSLGFLNVEESRDTDESSFKQLFDDVAHNIVV